jgi:hypothetical protein
VGLFRVGHYLGSWRVYLACMRGLGLLAYYILGALAYCTWAGIAMDSCLGLEHLLPAYPAREAGTLILGCFLMGYLYERGCWIDLLGWLGCTAVLVLLRLGLYMVLWLCIMLKYSCYAGNVARLRWRLSSLYYGNYSCCSVTRLCYHVYYLHIMGTNDSFYNVYRLR